MVSGSRSFRDLQDLLVHDTVAGRAADLAGRHGGRVVGSASEVAAASDTVLLATWSRRPLLGLAETRPGQHCTTLGVDEPGEQELAADLLEASFLVVDDRGLAAAAGVPAGGRRKHADHRGRRARRVPAERALRPGDAIGDHGLRPGRSSVAGPPWAPVSTRRTPVGP
ncbi:hypothetical protein ACH5AO_34765 [Streptomyces sp. NPDC018964]|uniref:hypothetical protein n=1 Tax=unclassified Streptomyces TaxID=2593676 RepID=UPI0037BD77FE